MSTRSSILFEAKDSSVRSAFCHYDGYPHDGGVGETLLFHWKDPAKVCRLVRFGYLDSIRSQYAGIVLNEEARKLHNVKCFYATRYVDFSESDFINDKFVAKAPSMEAFLKMPFSWDQRLESYVYLYKESEQAWYLWKNLKGRPIPLNIAIENAYLDNIRELMQDNEKHKDNCESNNRWIKRLYANFVAFRKHFDHGISTNVEPKRFQCIIEKCAKGNYRTVRLCRSDNEGAFLNQVIHAKSLNDLSGLPQMSLEKFTLKATFLEDALMAGGNPFGKYLLLNKGKWFADSFWFKEPVELAHYLTLSEVERDELDLSLQVF